MAKRFSVEAVFEAIDRISVPVRRMQKHISTLSVSAIRGFAELDAQAGNYLNRLEAGFHNTRRSLARFSNMVRVTAATALAGTFGYAMRLSADFEHTMVSAASKFPEAIAKGTEEFETVRKAVREVGRTTQFTSNQVASATEAMAMAGFQWQSAIASLTPMTDLAVAGQVDLKQATTIAAKTLGSFQHVHRYGR